MPQKQETEQALKTTEEPSQPQAAKPASSPENKEKPKTLKRSREKPKETKFKEWNFQKRKETPQVASQTEHPSVAMMAKINKRREKPIENKDLMPAKTLARYINVIYAQRTLEMGGARRKPDKDRRGATLSPEPRSKNRAGSDDVNSNNSQIKQTKATLEVNITNKAAHY